jgi:acyl carrier protein
MEIPQKLKDYINESRAPLPPVSDPDEPLQIDSLGLIRLVAFMESDCGIRVEDEELIAENFATMRSLSQLIEQKSQNAQASS